MRTNDILIRLKYAVALSLLLVAGCGRPNQTRSYKIDSDRWDVMTNTRFSHAYVEDVTRNNQVKFEGVNNSEFRKLLKNLGPLREAVVQSVATTNYLVVYQAGMDPASIPVFVDEDSLVFKVFGTWYRGGNKERFLSILNSKPHPCEGSGTSD